MTRTDGRRRPARRSAGHTRRRPLLRRRARHSVARAPCSQACRPGSPVCVTRIARPDRRPARQARASPKSEDLDAAVSRAHHVLGFEIAVHDSRAVGGRERRRDVARRAQDLGGRGPRCGKQFLSKRPAIHVLGRDRAGRPGPPPARRRCRCRDGRDPPRRRASGAGARGSRGSPVSRGATAFNATLRPRRESVARWNAAHSAAPELPERSCTGPIAWPAARGSSSTFFGTLLGQSLGQRARLDCLPGARRRLDPVLSLVELLSR